MIGRPYTYNVEHKPTTVWHNYKTKSGSIDLPPSC
jgi:hypothetical protein